jgi:hypothetical protein
MNAKAQLRETAVSRAVASIGIAIGKVRVVFRPQKKEAQYRVRTIRCDLARLDSFDLPVRAVAVGDATCRISSILRTNAGPCDD